ncbi:MAG TPA: hypothetical protein VFA60_13280 [Terriglobales bacterium]|nr:hypothetical protein [Terriglobales bacterium]
MNPYGASAYSFGNPTAFGYGTPYSQPFSFVPPAPFQSRFAQAPIQPLGEQQVLGGINPSETGNIGIGAQFGQPPHISPEQFAGALRQPIGATFGLPPTDATFITELSRSARGLVEVAEQLETREPDQQRRAYFAATAHLFYAFGLLASKGIFIPADLPSGRVRTEAGGPANATREFGKQLERLVDRYASGRGVIEELTSVIERGKICYLEITRGIEGAEMAGGEQQARKKVA